MRINLSRKFLIVLMALVFVGGVGTAYAGVSLSTITLGGNVEVIGDMEFTTDNTSLTFPATTQPNQPMIEMFKSGTFNGDRMVLGHSQAFPEWGLEYRDGPDEFVFRNPTVDAVTIGLNPPTFECDGCINSSDIASNAIPEIQVIRDQESVTVTSNFIKEMVCPAGFVAISSGINTGSSVVVKNDGHQASDDTGATWIWRIDNPGPGSVLTNFDLICMQTSVYSFNFIG